MFDNTIEVLRLNTPEEFARPRVYELEAALYELKKIYQPTIPKSPEVESHQYRQEAAVITEAEQITQEAVADMTVERLSQQVDALYEGNPLYDKKTI